MLASHFASLATAVAPLAAELTASYGFESWCADFEQCTSMPADLRAQRKAIFAVNLATILEHNSDSQWTYKMGVNAFTALTVEEFRNLHLGGYDKNMAQAIHSTMPLSPPLSETDLPTDVDWRTKGNVVTPVKNQGGCGSCWAFSATETIESNVAINTKTLLELSPQQITSCAPNPNKCGGTGGCQGSTQWLGFEYVQGPGITSEKDYPYTATTGKCETEKIKPVANITGFVRLPTNNYTQLLSAIANVGPISISAAAEPWQMYESGVYNGNCGEDIDHAVQAVGYGMDGANGYWLVRNSWGASWGEKGYIRIQRTNLKKQCGVDTTPADGTACAGGPSKVTVCGLCGILSDSSYVTGGHTM
tara:strand:+ start:35 stop:1120 length:1086 start_codon:yes stop_codon:yes gene_type:complete